MFGVVFIELPTAVSPLGLGGAGFVAAWLIGLLLALALALWIHLRVQQDSAEG